MKQVSELLTVFVATHIIRADTDPYIENKMIVETIKQSHKSLGLRDTLYKIYPDAKFKRTHPELSKKYYSYLQSMANTELAGINVQIVEDTRETMRENWVKFVEQDCKTPYMMFLEHDWSFPVKIKTDEILRCFENNPSIGYIKLNRFRHDEKMRNLASPNNWDWIFEQEEELDLNIPLLKITFFSGNPHIARVKACKELYLSEMLKHCPREKSKGTSHLEKDMKKAELFSIDSRRTCGRAKDYGHIYPLSSGHRVGNGCPQCERAIREHQKHWGLYMIGKWGDPPRIGHLGDWCRKE